MLFIGEGPLHLPGKLYFIMLAELGIPERVYSQGSSIKSYEVSS